MSIYIYFVSGNQVLFVDSCVENNEFGRSQKVLDLFRSSLKLYVVGR